MANLGHVYAKTAISCWTKATWAAAWTLRPTLTPVSAVMSAQPEMSLIQVAQHYGKIAREGTNAFAAEAPLNLSGQYLKVGTADGAICCVGVIPQSGYDLSGNMAADPTGVQHITAYGLEYLLGRAPIRWAHVQQGSDYWEIGRLPTFNVQHRDGGTVLGNRIAAQHGGKWYFAAEAGASIWSAKDILNYLLAWHAPGGPAWALGGQIDDLANYVEVVSLEGLTVRQALDKIIDRRRGYSWCVTTDGAAASPATIQVFSILDANVSVAGFTFTANPAVQSFTLDAEDNVGAVQVRDDRTAVCDTVRVQGARVKSCFTVSFADGTLEPGWASADESDYAGGAVGAGGYAGLTLSEKEIASDQARGAVGLCRVYSYFRLPKAWDWTAGDGAGGDAGIVNPVILEDTGEIDAEDGVDYATFDNAIQPWLPLREGADYSTAGFPTVLPDDAEPRFLRPFAILQNRAGKYVFAHKLNDPHYPDFQFTPATRELAFSVLARPPHILGLGHFREDIWSSDAEPTQWEPGYDYETLLATICVEADNHVEIIAQPGTPLGLEYAREALIRVPDAELWLAFAGTVVDLAEDGTLKRVAVDADSGGRYAVLRDDRARLQVIAALAQVWYCNPRMSLSVTWRRLLAPAAGDGGVDVGYLVETVTGGTSQSFTVNSVVTKMAWDFVKGETRLDTGWWAVDWHRVAPVNVHGQGDLRTLHAAVHEVQTDLMNVRAAPRDEEVA